MPGTAAVGKHPRASLRIPMHPCASHSANNVSSALCEKRLCQRLPHNQKWLRWFQLEKIPCQLIPPWGKKQQLCTSPSGVGCQGCDAVATVQVLRSL